MFVRTVERELCAVSRSMDCAWILKESKLMAWLVIVFWYIAIPRCNDMLDLYQNAPNRNSWL